MLSDSQKDTIRLQDSIKQIAKDSIDGAKLRNVLSENSLLATISDEKLDSLLLAEDFENRKSVNSVLKTKTLDSLLAIGATNELLYKEMGLEDDAGSFKRRFYKQVLKVYKSRKGGSILQSFYDNVPVAMFFLLPIFALILKLLYLKKGTYVHHLVFSFYYFSFLFTVFSIILLVNFIFDIPDALDFLIMLSTFVYLIIALKRFYLQSWLRSLFKGVIASFVFLSIVTPITFVVLSIFAFLFY